MQADAPGVSVGEAARALGISIPAVRKRIRRGTLRAYKVDGLWRIIIPALSEPGSGTASPEAARIGEAVGQAALIAQLRSENEYLRGLVAELTRRIPALPPPVPTGDPQRAATPAEMPHSGQERPVSRPTAPSWWQRLLSRRRA